MGRFEEKLEHIRKLYNEISDSMAEALDDEDEELECCEDEVQLPGFIFVNRHLVTAPWGSGSGVVLDELLRAVKESYTKLPECGIIRCEKCFGFCDLGTGYEDNECAYDGETKSYDHECQYGIEDLRAAAEDIEAKLRFLLPRLKMIKQIIKDREDNAS